MPLPVTRVVLYKHGVGYFERQGHVSGDAALTLGFKQRDVSDVLKSLTVLDLDGGTISAVSYDATTPVEQLLRDIALSIPDEGSLAKLLPQLKGARIAYSMAGGEREATLLGVEKVYTRVDVGILDEMRVAVISDTGEVETFPMHGTPFRLLDERLRTDLDFYLKTQLSSKKKDARTFTLFARGDGDRQVRVSYVLEAPVWKATYRMLLDEPAADGAKSNLIQGWAVVDNTQDEDWTDVRLSLVAGLPVSFAHDLYTPRYIRRPVVEVQETTGVLPPIIAAGMAADESVQSYLMEMDDAPAAQLDAQRGR